MTLADFLSRCSFSRLTQLHYYQKNDFKFLYGSEINEAKALGVNVKKLGSSPLHTRLMYFDLIDIK